MTQNVLLNNIDHHDLRVIARHASDYGDSVNLTPIFPTEFEEAQREYPILFQRSEDGVFHAVVLLGLDLDENLFLTDAGWQARYIPAIHRRGPFMIGLQEKDDGTREPMIHIDLTDPRVSRDDGEPIFLPHGGNSLYLEHVAGVLRTIYSGLEQAQHLFVTLDQLELIAPVEIEAALSDEEQYSLPGFYTIDQNRLADLDSMALKQLNQSGYLRLAYLVAASLGNVSRLIDLKNRKNVG